MLPTSFSYFLFCHAVLTIDVMDVSGSHQEDVEHTVLKKRLDSHGNLIGIPMKEGMVATPIWNGP